MMGAPVYKYSVDGLMTNNESMGVLGNVNNKSQSNIQYAEVVELLLDTSDSNKYNMGDIKFRLLSESNSKSSNNHLIAKPINQNLIILPMLHEIVSIVSIMGTLYYTNIVSYNGFIHNNIYSTPLYDDESINDSNNYGKHKKNNIANVKSSGALSKNYMGTGIKDSNDTVPNIKLTFGDVVLRGRYGNSILLSNSDNKGNIKFYISDNPEKDFFIKEDSEYTNSVLMLNKELLEFKHNTIEIKEINNPPKQFDGNQMYIGFDRITLNSYVNDIIGYSNKGIFFCSNKNFGINTDTDFRVDSKKTIITANKIKLGSDDATQPLVLGNELVSLLKDLISEIQKIQVATTSGPSGVPNNSANFKIISDKLTNILSKQNTTL